MKTFVYSISITFLLISCKSNDAIPYDKYKVNFTDTSSYIIINGVKKLAYLEQRDSETPNISLLAAIYVISRSDYTLFRIFFKNLPTVSKKFYTELENNPSKDSTVTIDLGNSIKSVTKNYKPFYYNKIINFNIDENGKKVISFEGIYFREFKDYREKNVDSLWVSGKLTVQ